MLFLVAAGASKVRVQCPEVEGNDKLIGQLLEVEVASLQDTVGELKERLAGRPVFWCKVLRLLTMLRLCSTELCCPL